LHWGRRGTKGRQSPSAGNSVAHDRYNNAALPRLGASKGITTRCLERE